MKIPISLMAMTALAAADQVVIPRISSIELAKLQQASPMKNLQKPAAGKVAAAPAVEQSIVKQSVILHDGRNWTLVPKGAVVFTPTSLKSRVDAKPVGNLLAWADFFMKNRSWITTNDVSFNQAAGTEPIPAARVAFWAKQDKVVIAVHQSGPISVRLAEQTKPIAQQ